MPLSNPALAVEFLRAIVDTAAQGIIISTPQGEIFFANATADKIFGYGEGGLIGRSVDSLVPAPQREVHAGHRANYFQNPRSRPMGKGLDLEGVRADGTTVPVEISLTSATFEDAQYAIAFISDVSSRIELQKQLVSAQRMEAMGQLAGGIAHDFNNMLTAIMGSNALVMQELPPTSTARRHAEHVLVACERSKALIRQIVDFSARQIVRLEDVDLNDVVEGMKSMMDRTLGEHIHLVTALAPSLPNIRGDRTQIEQVIVNLAVNAKDAMPAGGNLIVETRVVDLDENYVQGHFGVTPGRFVQLSVSDTGQGMSSETRSNAMSPFFTTKKPGKGTGLGLSIVYGIVKRHRGDVWIYSEPNQGTTVKIYFPLTSQPALKAEKELPGAKTRETILVVEDEEIVRDVVVRMLNQFGYNVYAVPDADQAIRFSRRHSGDIDLLFSDLRLPRGTGFEVASAILTQRPKMALLFASGYFDQTGDERGKLPFGAEVLAKPFTAEDLEQAIRRALQRSQE